MTRLCVRLLALLAAAAAVFATEASEAFTAAGEQRSSLPNAEDSDKIEVYFLESSFPYNVPASIRSHSGQTWLSFGLSHAGIGFKNRDANNKDHTLEFLSESYVGSLLPTTSNNKLSWSNAGSVIVTKGVNSTYWLQSTYLATISGAVFTDLSDWLEANQWTKFAYFQPVTVMNPGTQQIVAAGLDSYSFAHEVLRRLASRGVELKTFADTYRTQLTYYSSEAPETISNPSGAQNEDIIDFYNTLSACLHDLYFEQSHSAPDFIEDIGACYSTAPITYVYSGVNSYLALNLSSPYAAITRQRVEMPDEKDRDSPDSVWIDYFAGVMLILSFLLGVLYTCHSVRGGKKRRRNLSMQAQTLSAHLLSPWEPQEVQMVRNRMLSTSVPSVATLVYADPPPGQITSLDTNPFLSTNFSM